MMGEEEVRKRVAAIVKDFPDFPKKGVLFKDLMPLMAQPALFKDVCDVIADRARSLTPKVTGVAGLEARGFLFGPQVAMSLGVPFVPIRKKGKLPGPTTEAEYEKEYGKDVVAVQEGVIGPEDNIFIVDDLLATGGTMAAAVSLVRKCGGVVGEAYVLVELDELEGRRKLPGVPVHALLHY